MKRIIAIILIAPFLSGCATIISSSNQSLPINSSPQNATVTVDGQNKYTTPIEVSLWRKQDHSLFFQKDGYEDTTFVIKRAMNGAVAGNILAGGLIGWGVDAISGAQFKLIPETVNVALVKKGDVAGIEKKRTITQKLDELDVLLKDKRITPQEYDKLKMEALNSQNG